MRLWSLHPRHLDAKGLVALWREALLAQKVLQGGTRGYRNHPQLDRFRCQPDPVAAIAAYLREVQHEATRRGYRFDAGKIAADAAVPQMAVTLGQVDYEAAHLKVKLERRDPVALQRLEQCGRPALHPLFHEIEGGIEPWEVL